MKAIINYLLISGIISLVFFSCSNGDDHPSSRQDSYLNGVYENTDASLKLLNFTFNGVTLSDKKVAFKTEDLKIASITFYSVIEGEAESQIKNVSIEKSDTGYRFEGLYTAKSNQAFRYSGKIAGESFGKQTLTLKLDKQ